MKYVLDIAIGVWNLTGSLYYDQLQFLVPHLLIKETSLMSCEN